ncbi:hypothetical protein RclHR1_02220004 [Rhizophagus clarus]|uniref:Protein kinase domain-containing protein n=1 Tax=Rhizophagus clarus TaxID=94130 RepID=A0A2Z6R7A2_9GLOM|nr:hypothetical protein RclHR1_02220004 [Rhizophagus clarus]
MELVNTNDDDSFDPTPRLKSSPIPIKFISFNECDKNCVFCSEEYISARFCDSQRYCKKCLSSYINDILGHMLHNGLGIRYSSDIERCIDKNYTTIYDDSEKDCKLCYRKSLHAFTGVYLAMCSDCYLISSGLIESTLAKKKISILYLPMCVNQIKWIPYSQFEDVKEITKGGYGTIYKATYLDCPRRWGNKKVETVILKRFKKSKNINNINEYFLNELKSFQQFFKEEYSNIIKAYGFTKDPELDDYMLVIKYASGGDLHKYLQKNFIYITWNKQKLLILWQISEGLKLIHKKNFIHRDFHSGNILFVVEVYDSVKKYQCKVADLGLSQTLNNNNTDPNNEVYGVIPYIAPEIFKGSDFSKEADIYSLGMIMWELTTGCKPFDDVKHDIHLVYKIIDGERPKITEDTPECYANLMKSCWDPDPKKRPSIKKIRNTFDDWYFRNEFITEFDQAEEKRKKLIELKMIGPEFAEKRHLEVIYTSRPLSTFISMFIYKFNNDTRL